MLGTEENLHVLDRIGRHVLARRRGREARRHGDARRPERALTERGEDSVAVRVEPVHDVAVRVYDVDRPVRTDRDVPESRALEVAERHEVTLDDLEHAGDVVDHEDLAARPKREGAQVPAITGVRVVETLPGGRPGPPQLRDEGRVCGEHQDVPVVRRVGVHLDIEEERALLEDVRSLGRTHAVGQVLELGREPRPLLALVRQDDEPREVGVGRLAIGVAARGDLERTRVVEQIDGLLVRIEPHDLPAAGEEKPPLGLQLHVLHPEEPGLGIHDDADRVAAAEPVDPPAVLVAHIDLRVRVVCAEGDDDRSSNKDEEPASHVYVLLGGGGEPPFQHAQIPRRPGRRRRRSAPERSVAVSSTHLDDTGREVARQ